MIKTSKAFAPASIANINVGFDLLGMAFPALGDTVEVSHNGTTQNKIVHIESPMKLPYELEDNCCGVVIEKMKNTLNIKEGVDITINKGMDSGSGLGSSSASSVAAAMAYNGLLNNPLDKRGLLPYATAGEYLASGAIHLDNVAPCMMGGMTLSHHLKTIYDVIELPVLEDLYAIALFPKIVINTKESRSKLLHTIPVKLATNQIGNMASFMVGLYKNDIELIKLALKDEMIEPQRKNDIPRFDEMKEAAMDSGALGFGISGSGPTVFAICIGQSNAHKIQEAVVSAFKPSNLDYTKYISKITHESGAKII